MKPGKMRYVLIAGVILVWGSILLRILKTWNRDEDPTAALPMAKAGFARVRADSFSLLANYPDPFLTADGNYEEDLALPDTTTKIVARMAADTLQVREPPVDMGFIKYLGFLSDPGKKIKRAFLNIQGADYFAKEKDLAGGVRIVKIMPEKILVVYKNRRFEIKPATHAAAGF